MNSGTQSTPLILVFTQDIDFYLFLDHSLQGESISTELAGDIEQFWQLFDEQKPDAILLDCRTGSFTASYLCRTVRQNAATQETPIIVLVSQAAETDYIDLIKLGIADVFVQPVIPAKLIEGLRKVSADRDRKTNFAAAIEKAVRYAGVEMNLATYRVQRNGQNLHLSPIEFKLLRHLLEHAEQVVTREELKNAAWQENVHVGPRTVDVHVGRLRKALLSVSEKDLIRTVRSVGYALSDHIHEEAITDR